MPLKCHRNNPDSICWLWLKLYSASELKSEIVFWIVAEFFFSMVISAKSAKSEKSRFLQKTRFFTQFYSTYLHKKSIFKPCSWTFFFLLLLACTVWFQNISSSFGSRSGSGILFPLFVLESSTSGSSGGGFNALGLSSFFFTFWCGINEILATCFRNRQ